MCNPVAASAASFVFNTVNTLNQARTARDQAALQARIAADNARIAREEAHAEADRRRRDGRRERATFRAALGTSGVSAVGSPVDALASSTIETEIDALDLLRRGRLRAREFEIARNHSISAGREATRQASVAIGRSLLSNL